MAESQLQCMEDGQIGQNVPENRPEFYYSETHRAAIEELLRNGDGAFKTRLRADNVKDFLSAREIKAINSSVEQYGEHEDRHADDTTSLRSTYFPEVSDTEVPLLDIGWINSAGFFRGVTRVMVHTHPPKDNGPHIKEVVRRLIQEAHKVIAIVMDLLTDLQILQDLLDAASKRSVSVYIILDSKGGPHFLDMCSRLEVGPQHLQHIRTRLLRGIGIDLSCGRIPGSLNNKYMLVDGDKVMFGSYSFSWSSSRMDRNTIIIMSGQIVEMFDRDFRELYAMSRELNLFKEFSITKRNTAPSTRVTVTTRPTLPATSRFQVSLGEKGTLKVPAHKYHNPKYLLALGGLPEDLTSQDLMSKMEESLEKFGGVGNPVEEENEMLESQTPNMSRKEEKGSKISCVPSKKKRFSFLRKSKQKSAGKNETGETGAGDPAASTSTNLRSTTSAMEDITESPEESTAETPVSGKKKSKKKKNKKSTEPQTDDQASENKEDSKKKCVIS
ncbi:protein FAM83F-like [Clarias gariepinus]